jgi:hypothetical protein
MALSAKNALRSPALAAEKSFSSLYQDFAVRNSQNHAQIGTLYAINVTLMDAWSVSAPMMSPHPRKYAVRHKQILQEQLASQVCDIRSQRQIKQ